MPMLSATISTGRTTAAAEKDLMATAETALVAAKFMYFFFHTSFLAGSRQNVEVNKFALSPFVILSSL